MHGDDFSFAGRGGDLDWVKGEMGRRFLVKVVGVLGLTYEADPRHAEILVQTLCGEERALSVPGLKPSAAVGDAQELGSRESGLFRSCAARANYLSLDRPDVAFATKELCRRMRAPTCGDLQMLRKVARYLLGSPRLLYRYTWQAKAGLRTYTDTDFAGCLDTRRSTSGGCIFYGNHMIKHWSTTQKVVTLSSAEAELAGIVKSVGEALGLQSLAADLGIQAEISVHADSSAAIGICRRSGIGRVRHLAVSQLWVQERLKAGAFRLIKVAGGLNPADALTKVLARDGLDRHLATMSVVREAGRAESAPQLNADIDRTLVRV